jgi:hypothetical protein
VILFYPTLFVCFYENVFIYLLSRQPVRRLRFLFESFLRWPSDKDRNLPVVVLSPWAAQEGFFIWKDRANGKLENGAYSRDMLEGRHSCSSR